MTHRSPFQPLPFCASQPRHGEQMQPNNHALPLERDFPRDGRCKHIPRLYLIFLGGFLDGDHSVETVSLGPVAHHADGLLVLLAEELQSLLVLLAEVLLSRCSSCPRAQLPGDLGNVCQLSAGTETLPQSRLPALGAAEMCLQPFPAAGDARPAEVVAAVDGDGVLEITQADGAGGFAVQAFHWALCSHGSSQPTSRTGSNELRFAGRRGRCSSFWLGRFLLANGRNQLPAPTL